MRPSARPLLLVFLFALSACASKTKTAEVIPGSDGVNSVSATAAKKETAEEAVRSAAEKYCRSFGQTAVFVVDRAPASEILTTEPNRSRDVYLGAGVGAGAFSIGGLVPADRQEPAQAIARFQCR